MKIYSFQLRRQLSNPEIASLLLLRKPPKRKRCSCGTLFYPTKTRVALCIDCNDTLMARYD